VAGRFRDPQRGHHAQMQVDREPDRAARDVARARADAEPSIRDEVATKRVGQIVDADAADEGVPPEPRPSAIVDVEERSAEGRS
jgi:hypothetical protein